MRAERYALPAIFVGTIGMAALLDDSSLALYVLFTLAAIVTVGVSLLMGQAGQVSLGQGAFYACGAYTTGVLTTHGVPGLVGLLAAPLVAGGLAFVIGLPLLLLRGQHLAFATLATHIIFLSVVGEMTITGGDVGLQGIPPLHILGFEFSSVRSYAYLSSFALLGVVVVARNILASRPGRALRALSTSEIAAASSGIPVGRYKLAVFALSAGFAGLAGGIYAPYMGYLAPGSFPVILSIEYLVMAAVGGLGTIAGAIIGSAVVLLLVHILSRVATMSGMPDALPVILSYAVYAVLLGTAVLFLPRGIVSVAAPAWQRTFRRARRTSHSRGPD
jgi:branched-chain amino acid transport system permease protein